MHFLKIEPVRKAIFFCPAAYRILHYKRLIATSIPRPWTFLRFYPSCIYVRYTYIYIRYVRTRSESKKSDRQREIVLIRERENITRRQISPRSLHSLVIFSRSIAVGGGGKTIVTISFRCEPDWWGAFVTYCWNLMRVLRIRRALLIVLVFSLLGSNFLWSGLRVMFIFVFIIKIYVQFNVYIYVINLKSRQI
jgi:hypothetical protein